MPSINPRRSSKSASPPPRRNRQAEDGIRDDLVTGVQTCALPIRSEEHTSELQSPDHLVCRLLLDELPQLIRIKPPHHDHKIMFIVHNNVIAAKSIGVINILRYIAQFIFLIHPPHEAIRFIGLGRDMHRIHPMLRNQLLVSPFSVPQKEQAKPRLVKGIDKQSTPMMTATAYR